MSELSILSKDLFGNPDSAISDIKFYPAGGPFTADEMACVIRDAIADIKAGNGEDIDLNY